MTPTLRIGTFVFCVDCKGSSMRRERPISLRKGNDVLFRVLLIFAFDIFMLVILLQQNQKFSYDYKNDEYGYNPQGCWHDLSLFEIEIFPSSATTASNEEEDAGITICGLSISSINFIPSHKVSKV